MDKQFIKNLLREGLTQALLEDDILLTEKESNSEKNTKNTSFDKDYDEVQRKLGPGSIIKQNQVMRAAFPELDPDDATDRSLFSKKVRKEKNEEGGQYMFDEKELAAVVRVLNNPPAYYGKT